MRHSILVGATLAGALFATSALADSDLIAQITDSPDPVTAGNDLTHTITLINNGPDPASAAQMSVTLAPGTTFTSLNALGGGWSCFTPPVGSGGTINCSNPSFIGGSNFILVSTVDATVAGGTVLSVTATAISASPDPIPGNESATATTTVTAAPALPVPTLSEWAMILLGTMLAGGAAILLQRRRIAA